MEDLMLNFDKATKQNQDIIDTVLKNYADAAKSVQAITAEAADYSKKSFEDAVSHVGTLSSAKSLEAVLEMQNQFAKSYYENFVAEAAKIGDMYAGLAKSVYKPYRAASPEADDGVGKSVGEPA
jgi:hypothetical protein